jgi:peroxiredoxin
MGIIRSHAIIGPDGRIEDLRIRVKPQESVQAAVDFLAAHSDSGPA